MSTMAQTLAAERLAGPAEPGKWAAVGLSLFMHALLIVALLVSVRWQTRAVPLQAELWREIPQQQTAPPPAPEPVRKADPVVSPPAVKQAAPPPPAQPVRPAPRPPDIAVAREKPKPPPKPAPKPASKAKPKPVEKPPALDFSGELEAAEREINRRRETQEKAEAAEREAKAIEAARAEAAASARARALDEYRSRIINKIRGNIVLPPGIKGNPEAEFVVTQLPDGAVLGVRLSRSSGQPLLDEAIERAIMKSSPLPKPTLPELFQRELRLRYRPYEQ